MTTKTEMIAIIKAENPTIQVGDDEQGYTQLISTLNYFLLKHWLKQYEVISFSTFSICCNLYESEIDCYYYFIFINKFISS
jgi:hypothetical protein